MSEKLAFSIKEISEIAPIGRTAIYQAIRRGELPIRKRGRSTLVLREDLVAFLNQLPSPTGKSIILPEAKEC